MSTTIEIDVTTMLPWSPPERVMTSNGERLLSKAAPTEQFWLLWRSNCETLKELGVSCGKNKSTDQWEVCYWRPLDQAQASQEKQQREAALALTWATDADVDIPRPDGLEYLGYQKAGVQFGLTAWNAGRGVLIADEMGLGKTIQLIGLINSRPDIKKVLIICPNTLKRNWLRELRKWLTRSMIVAVQDAGCGYVGNHADVMIVNYDIVSRYLESLQRTKWDLWAVDESHYIKNPKAKRTKAALSIAATFKAALSGTPLENRPVELWPVISHLDPVTWNPKKGFFKFALRYCAAQRNGYGWDFGGASNMVELQQKLRSTIMVRRLKADVLHDLPPKRHQIIELENDLLGDLLQREKESGRLTQQRLDELRARVELAKASDDRTDYLNAVSALQAGNNAAFAEAAIIRHELGLAKLPQAVSFIEDVLENGKCLVFCHHIDVASGLKRAFPQAAMIIGATKDRMAEVDRFQNNPACNVFIGNDAAAEGLTLTAGNHVVFVEMDWKPSKLAQKSDRAHRIGQKDSVLVSYLVLEGTFDAYMIRLNVTKMQIIDNVLDKAFDVDVEDVTEPPPEQTTKAVLT